MPYPWSTLLLATEHTEFDVGAERVAFELARRRGVPLAAVMPIVSNVEYESVAPELVARMEESVHERLVALQDAAAHAGVVVDVHVRRGDEPWREIVAEAKARGADLVICRRRGKGSFFRRLMVGEMVGKVATAAPCSVLMVPRAAGVWARRIVAGVDNTRMGPEVARAAARVAVSASLPLAVVSVALHDLASERAAAEAVVASAVAAARAEGAQVEGQVVTGRAADAIAALAKEAGADLLVVGRGGPEAHGRLHLGGNAYRIVGLAGCAVLVVKP